VSSYKILIEAVQRQENAVFEILSMIGNNYLLQQLSFNSINCSINVVQRISQKYLENIKCHYEGLII
jgi:hypothetical protein